MLSPIIKQIRIMDDEEFLESVKRNGGIITPLDILERTERFYDEGYDAGITFPSWPTFSKHYRVARRELNIITGIPGHGKSEFMDAMIMQLYPQTEGKYLFFSPENYPQEIHAEKLLSKLYAKPFHKGPSERMAPTDIAAGLWELEKYIIFLSADEEHTNLEWVLNTFEMCIKKEKIAGVIIDPWNEIETNKPKDVSETEYVGQSLRRCRKFAREHDIAFWIVAHPTKITRDKDSNRSLIPRPYDIAGSANWYNKADNCLCVYREQDNTTTVHVQKIKFKIRGMVGSVKFMYDRPTGIFNEIPGQESVKNDYTSFE